MACLISLKVLLEEGKQELEKITIVCSNMKQLSHEAGKFTSMYLDFFGTDFKLPKLSSISLRVD